jgi:porin
MRTAYETERATIRLAILDGVAGDPEDLSSNAVDLGGDDGILGVAEVDVALGSGTRVWLGGWRYTRDFDLVGSMGRRSGNDGWYAGIEHHTAVAHREASFFVRYGGGDEDVNTLDTYVGLGLTIERLIPGRPNDGTGLAMARAEPGDSYRSLSGGSPALIGACRVA